MKLFKILCLLTVITAFSCSKDTDDTSDLPTQGSISLALSNGAGFPVENLEATITKQYDTDKRTTITITGTAGSSGKVKITIVDNDDSFNAIVKDNSFPIGDTTKSFYMTVDYESDNFNLKGAGGTLKITNYSEINDQNYSKLNATFSTVDNNFNTMASTISGLILNCTGC